MSDVRPVRCAIYTRKSSEEGLEQSFNSLDAQREACESYIASQRHEGWQCSSARYDDGGFSGGNLERPALKALMTDLRAGKVDLIVVYKIDRLTRSLMDFSSLVTVFDSHKASFVSVTQHFNTTTSMGRLTLNVLLSFAQFEREVTGERIRDKIAASKRKGMWMGGRVSLGYVVIDRQLKAEPHEADKVRRLFTRYLQLQSVNLLREELKHNGERVFSRGALYQLLQNRLYRGEITHKDAVYAGQHEAIVPQELWEAVQTQLASNRDERKLRAGEDEGGLLIGRVFDSQGVRLTPSHAVKGTRRYRYYTRRKQLGETQQIRLSVPAHDLEALTTAMWLDLLSEPDLDQSLEVPDESPQVGQWLRQAAHALKAAWSSQSVQAWRETFIALDVRVIVDQKDVTLRLSAEALRDHLLDGKKQGGTMPQVYPIERQRAIVLARSGGERRVVEPHNPHPSKVTASHEILLATIARGRRWYEDLTQGRANNIADIAHREDVTDALIHHTLQCTLIPIPQLERLLDGKADPGFGRALALRGFEG
jgi:site-specific DNA recombinase